jgi:hypothetical protein
MADSPTINSQSPHSMAPVAANTAASAANVSDTRGFFDFPLEIRRAIYKEAGLIKKQTIQPIYYSTDRPGDVLCLSKAFNEEVAPLIYGSREFLFPDFNSSITFIDTIGSKNASYIRHYRVRAFDPMQFWTPLRGPSLTAFLKSVTDNCPNLRSFKVYSITLKKRAKHIAVPGAFASGCGSFEDIKEIGDAFPQLSNASYLEKREQLCLAAPDATEAYRLYDNLVSTTAPTASDYELFNLEEEFKKHKRRVRTNARRRQQYAQRRDKLKEGPQE